MLVALENFINGRSTTSPSNRIPFMDPSTGQELGSAPQTTAEDIDAAFEAANQAFDSWSSTTPKVRQKYLLDFADKLETHAAEIVEAEVRNTGKPRTSTKLIDFDSAIDKLRFFAGACRVMTGLSQGEYVEGLTSSIRREAIGVIAQVTPWNYPFMMAVWKIAPALAAGNTVVLKPSETTPWSAVLLAELSADVLPPGILNVICGDREVGSKMVSHPLTDMVAITGSTRAGSEVMISAAAGLKNIHLELGGKAPAVVFDDADLNQAVTTLTQIGYFNAGQDCTAPTRILVHENVYPTFLKKLVEAARQTRNGHPDDPNAYFGAVSSTQHQQSILGFLDRLPDHAKILTGGRSDREGYFIDATVVAGVRQDDEIVQQEVFGPVLTVQSFHDETEAVALANDIDYGLASSIWTTDHQRATRVSAKFNFGCIWINCHGVVVAEMPHGGYKKSGFGKDLSMYGLEEYTRIKHVMSSHS